MTQGQQNTKRSRSSMRDWAEEGHDAVSRVGDVSLHRPNRRVFRGGIKDVRRRSSARVGLWQPQRAGRASNRARSC